MNCTAAGSSATGFGFGHDCAANAPIASSKTSGGVKTNSRSIGWWNQLPNDMLIKDRKCVGHEDRFRWKERQARNGTSLHESSLFQPRRNTRRHGSSQHNSTTSKVCRPRRPVRSRLMCGFSFKSKKASRRESVRIRGDRLHATVHDRLRAGRRDRVNSTFVSLQYAMSASLMNSLPLSVSTPRRGNGIVGRRRASASTTRPLSRTRSGRHSVQPVAISVSVRVCTKLPSTVPPPWDTRSISM